MWVITGFSHNVTPMYPKRWRAGSKSEAVMSLCEKTGSGHSVCVLINLFPGGRNWSEMMRFKRVNGCAALELSSVEWASRVRGWANGRHHSNQITSPGPKSLSQSVMTSQAWEHQTQRTRCPQASSNKTKVDGRKSVQLMCVCVCVYVCDFIMHTEHHKNFLITWHWAWIVTPLIASTPASNIVRSKSLLWGNSTCLCILHHCQLVSVRVYTNRFIFSKGQSWSPGVCQICCLCPGLLMASKPPW